MAMSIQSRDVSLGNNAMVITAVLVFVTIAQLLVLYDLHGKWNLLSVDLVEEVQPDVPPVIRITEPVDRLVSDPATYRPANRTSAYSWHVMGTPTRPLSFLHIPKSGGSSIENAATTANLAWGMCLFRTGVMDVKCPTRNNISANDMSASLDVLHQLQNQYSFTTAFWHVPIQFLPINFTRSLHYNPKWKNPYENSDVFVVIRNPYKRAVSEYYYFCSWQDIGCFETRKDTADEMNRDIQKVVNQVRDAGKPTLTNPNSMGYYARDSHWIPQFDYVYSSLIPQHQKMVQHVIHFEHLEDEFHSLVSAYGLDLNLTAIGVTYHNSKFKPQCTVADLSSETRKLIEDVYEKDFELGGYVMIEKTLADKIH
jgi:hypothetical protein